MTRFISDFLIFCFTSLHFVLYNPFLHSFPSSVFHVIETQIVGFRVEPMSIRHSWEGDAEFVPGQTVLRTCNDQIVPSNDAKNYQSGIV